MSGATLPVGMRDRGRVPNVELLQDRLEERMMVTMLQFLYQLPRDDEPCLLCPRPSLLLKFYAEELRYLLQFTRLIVFLKHLGQGGNLRCEHRHNAL